MKLLSILIIFAISCLVLETLALKKENSISITTSTSENNSNTNAMRVNKVTAKSSLKTQLARKKTKDEINDFAKALIKKLTTEGLTKDYTIDEFINFELLRCSAELGCQKFVNLKGAKEEIKKLIKFEYFKVFSRKNDKKFKEIDNEEYKNKDISFDDLKSTVKVTMFYGVTVEKDKLVDLLYTFYESKGIILVKGKILSKEYGHYHDNADYGQAPHFREQYPGPNYIYDYDEKTFDLLILAKENGHMSSKGKEKKAGDDAKERADKSRTQLLEMKKSTNKSKKLPENVTEINIPYIKKKNAILPYAKELKDPKKNGEFYYAKLKSHFDTKSKGSKAGGNNIVSAAGLNTLRLLLVTETPVIGDGFCLMRSIAGGDDNILQQNFLTIINQVSYDQLEANPELIHAIIDHWDSLEDFYYALFDPAGWAGNGGEGLIQMIARILKINITVVRDDGTTISISTPNALRTIVITHKNDHFNGTSPL